MVFLKWKTIEIWRILKQNRNEISKFLPLFLSIFFLYSFLPRFLKEYIFYWRRLNLFMPLKVLSQYIYWGFFWMFLPHFLLRRSEFRLVSSLFVSRSLGIRVDAFGVFVQKDNEVSRKERHTTFKVCCLYMCFILYSCVNISLLIEYRLRSAEEKAETDALASKVLEIYLLYLLFLSLFDLFWLVLSPGKKRPHGGNGGSGGNVYLVADKDLTSLTFQTFHFNASPGGHGGSIAFTFKHYIISKHVT